MSKTKSPQQLIISNNNNNNQGITLAVSNNTFTVTLAWNQASRRVSYTAGLRQWHQHTFVWNDGQLNVFVDGKLVANDNTTAVLSSPYSVAPLVLGGEGYNFVDFDDVFLWYTNLSRNVVFEKYRSVVGKIFLTYLSYSAYFICSEGSVNIRKWKR